MLPRRSVASLWTKQSSQLSLPGRITYRIYCPGVQQSRRYSQHHGSESRPSSSSRKTLVVSSLVLAATAALGAGVYQRNLRVNATRGDHNEAAEDCNPLARVPFRTLLRGYFVYTCCSIPILVDCGPAVVDWCRATSIPGVWSCFEFVVRNTFFPQFVGGETAEECVERIKELSQSSIGVILNYSAETDGKKEAKMDDSNPNSKLCMEKVEAILHSIRTSGSCFNVDTQEQSFSRNQDSVMVAVKLSGLIKDASVLERASACLVPRELFSEAPTTTPPSEASLNNHGPCANLNIPISSLSQHDVESLRQLWTALQDMAICARDNGNIRILIDAEYSWYQPAIDALFESCAQEFNKIPSHQSSWWSSISSRGSKLQSDKFDRFQGPLVYNTLQAYLRRTPSYLAMSLERAKRGGYSLGVKLVRGAYVDQENREWSTKIVPTPPSEGSNDRHLSSPVWPNKDLTDRCYNECADLLIKEVAKDVIDNRHKDQTNFARLGIVLAGHNWISNMTAIQTMIDTKLAFERESGTNNSTLTSTISPYSQLQLHPNVRGRIHFAQLYGMADDLTRAVIYSFDNVSGGPGPHLVLKYIPYGDLELVMPYLMRRAVENKSVMGGGTAQKEKSTLATEMRRRLFTWS